MKTFLIILCACFVFISCQKDPASPGTLPVTSDTANLARVVAFDTTRVAPFDTSYTLSYTYDNLNRVSTIIFYPYNSTGIVDTLNSQIETHVFSYFGNDSIASYRNSNYVGSLSRIRRESYYSYDGAGILLRDSASFYQIFPRGGIGEITISSYSVQSNPIRKISQFLFNGTVDTSYNLVSKNSGNVTLQKLTSYYFGNSDLTLDYDTMRNPFWKLNTWIGQYPNFIEGQPWLFKKNLINSYRMKNNIVKFKMTNVNQSGIAEQFDVQYKYNAMRYPTEMIFKNEVGGYLSPKINKVKFFYR